VPALDLAPVARKELSLLGIRSGSRADLLRALELAASGGIALPSLHSWSLAQVNEALGALHAGQVPGKAVIVVEREPTA
jgi:D-arabinose 1-dehydrogenase-like Zn-dependent alcohol dehydrogenase